MNYYYQNRHRRFWNNNNNLRYLRYLKLATAGRFLPHGQKSRFLAQFLPKFSGPPPTLANPISEEMCENLRFFAHDPTGNFHGNCLAFTSDCKGNRQTCRFPDRQSGLSEICHPGRFLICKQGNRPNHAFFCVQKMPDSGLLW